MIFFEEPSYLRYAAVLPLLAAGYLLSRYRLRQAQAGTAVAGRLAPAWPRLRLALRLLGGAALVLALANPQPGPAGSGPAPARAAAQVVFVVDVSQSMLAADVLPDRLAQAKKLVAVVVRGLHGAEAGVVVFAGTAQLYVPLTTDYEALNRACAAISPALVARPGTALPEALALAARVFGPARQPGRPAGRLICVVSDGESHTPRRTGMADSLARAGIGVLAIGVGTPEGAELLVPGPAGGPPVLKRDPQGQPVRSRLEEDALQQLVPARAGRYFRLTGWAAAAAQVLAEVEARGPAAAQQAGVAPAGLLVLCLLAAFGLLLAEWMVPLGRPNKSYDARS